MVSSSGKSMVVKESMSEMTRKLSQVVNFGKANVVNNGVAKTWMKAVLVTRTGKFQLLKLGHREQSSPPTLCRFSNVALSRAEDVK